MRDANKFMVVEKVEFCSVIQAELWAMYHGLNITVVSDSSVQSKHSLRIILFFYPCNIFINM